MASTSTSLFTLNSNSRPVFDGKNYEFWRIQMRTIFISEDLWEIVEDGYVEDTEELTAAKRKELKETKQKDAKALTLVHQCVSKTIFSRISGATTSKDAWDILKQQYQGFEKVVAMKLQNS